MNGDLHWEGRPQVPAGDAGPHGMLSSRPQSARNMGMTGSWQNDLRFSGSLSARAASPRPKPFVVKMDTDPSELPKNYYGTRVRTPLLQPQPISPRARPPSARPWREASPRLASQSPRYRPKSAARVPWGGNGGPLPWMCNPDGSMADDMNVVPSKYFKQLMQEAKDAAMADGELDDAEREALENPKERVRRMLAKTPGEISGQQRFQSEYSDIFHRKPPPGLYYAEAVIQPSLEGGYKPLPGDSRPRWQPSYVGGFDATSLAVASGTPVKGAPKTGPRKASARPKGRH